MDAVLGLILDTLEAKDLLDVVNVIITSDHGMTNVNMESRVTFVSCLRLYQKYINAFFFHAKG